MLLWMKPVCRTFQSTLPARGATDVSEDGRIDNPIFQSTLPARGATADDCQRKRNHPISIHAPRTGSDEAGDFQAQCFAHFNPRSPHGERRLESVYNDHVFKFQSTLPARGATPIIIPRSHCTLFQSTLPARGATIMKALLVEFLDNFNPRSPHGERLGVRITATIRLAFQSTLPARGATSVPIPHEADSPISIHAPRTGSDVSNIRGFSAHDIISIHAPRTGSDGNIGRIGCMGGYFNPRSPHGERPYHPCYMGAGAIFQSTLPARGATSLVSAATRFSRFQSTLPARGATSIFTGSRRMSIFQSTLPARGATPKHGSTRIPGKFQSTLPARGAT